MPRSKRKAATQDFQKKKTKLGRKARPDNFTNTTVKHKQVFVPDQSRSAEQLSSTQTGLPLGDLLSRTRHHNFNTRTAAFNALTNAVKFRNATAHSALILAPALGISAAAFGLGDETPAVRTASHNFLLSLWRFVSDVRPFRSIVSTALLACLSHIRLDIRLHSARALIALLGVQRISAEQLFAETANPLESLCDMLSVTTGTKGRTVVLDAVYAICGNSSRNSVAHQSQTPSRDRTPRQRTELSSVEATLSFYYHRPRSTVTNLRGIPLCSRLSVQLATTLISRVANLTTECFPLAETRRDPAKVALLQSATQTLHQIVTMSVANVDHKPVERALILWSEEDNGARFSAPDVNLARTAIHLGMFDVCREFIISAMKVKSSVGDFEACVAEYMKGCDDVSQVLETWATRFETAAREGNMSLLSRSMKICDVVLEREDRDKTVLWQLLTCIPLAVQACTRGRKDISAEAPSNITGLIDLFSRSYRRLAGRKQDEDELEALVRKLIDVVCTQTAAFGLEEKSVDEIVGIVVAAGLITSDAVVSFVGQCFASEKAPLAERFLMGVEAVVMNNGEERLRAVAMARTLLEVNGGVSASLRSQLQRIEAAVF
ncbi:hypothetical protein BWQ96_09634 [Gracilariopsis chorda]|uniref:Pre-rRNA-processing protein Ipi1 N-terminal domain-containing protein n=1 Tax=Gracilariopsis chorda TaxID=448386 RepID=A0A2V3IF16_9FLOR|nr:hypothetical protein BWQ96_09634 [Gracilariopsis chorda]|eukprot:PXF40653.1 hypothetical protein BWQ96_09634 [Gracilariopsis chorda]